jgi:hypothetical protein
MGRHVGLYSDHGVVHVRNVAEQLLAVLTQQHGVLLMQRPLPRLERMKGYGVLVAYLHDIGMIDFSDYGRTMHPEFASQAVFDPALADLVQTIWAQNSGNLPWYLLNLADQGLLAQPPMLVLRELLAMSLCHSKSKVPVAVLNRPEQLRARLIESISTSLPALFHTQRVRKAQARLAELPPGDVRIAARETAVAQATTAYEQFCQSNPDRHNPHLADYYQNPAQEAFPWLVSNHPQPRPTLSAAPLWSSTIFRVMSWRVFKVR